MATLSPPTPRSPLLLLLDWDGTLTAASTLPLIASIATSPHPHPHLAALSKAYADDLQAHDTTYRPAREERKTLAQELAYLDGLKSVERASIERIEASGILRGVGTEEVDGAAGHVVRNGSVRLRKGYAGLFERVQRDGGEVGILSVAWSRRFIYGVIAGWARCEERHRVKMEDVDVRANEIAEDGSGRLDRVFGADGGIWTAGDKVRVMHEVEATVYGEASVLRTIYVGDSSTDLPCLLKADVGICMRDEAMTGEQRGLQETLERIEVECLHVCMFEDEQEDDGNKRLWWARDFDEVCQSGVTGKLPEKADENGGLAR